jgi:hypothetical protein
MKDGSTSPQLLGVQEAKPRQGLPVYRKNHPLYDRPFCFSAARVRRLQRLRWSEIEPPVLEDSSFRAAEKHKKGGGRALAYL